MFFRKKALPYLLVVFLATSSLFAEEEDNRELAADYSLETPSLHGSAASSGANSSLAVSMMLWGVGLAIGIAVLSVLIESSTATTSSHNHAH